MEKVNINYHYFYGDKKNKTTVANFDFQDKAEIFPIKKINNTIYEIQVSYHEDWI